MSFILRPLQILRFVAGALVLFLPLRGGLQLLLPTSIAMLVHLGVVGVLIGLLVPFCSWRIGSRDFPTVNLIWVFLFTMLASSLLTTVSGFQHWYFYVGFHLYFVFAYVVLITIAGSQPSAVPFGFFFLVTGWLLLGVALSEQLFSLEMPGRSAVMGGWRPASLTGSMLHYPIIMALFAFINLEYFTQTRQKFYLISGLAFWMAPIMAFSRSGALVALVGMLIYGCLNLNRIHRHFGFLVCLAIVAICYVGLAVAFPTSSVGLKFWRVVSSLDLSEGANFGRIQAWVMGIEAWSDTNLVVGELTGKYTNATWRFSNEGSTIVESGVVQQLLNFGILGVVAYYGLLLLLLFRVSRSHHFLRAGLLAAILESIVYQSIEVVAFVTLLMMLPWVSQQLIHQPSSKRNLRFRSLVLVS